MTDADLQHWRERLAKVSGPTYTFDDLNEWHHDSRKIAKRLIAEIERLQRENERLKALVHGRVRP